MNERIADLLEQAFAECKTLEDGTTIRTSEALARFAELIVQECGIVGDDWVDNEDDGKNRISDKFRQHFGVKEL